MQVSFKTRLRANNQQVSYFVMCCGVARFAWNWGLAEWLKQYQQFRAGEIEKAPNWMALKKQLNSIKKEQFPWMSEVTKYAAQQPLHNLGAAWQNFLRKSHTKTVGPPRFKKKGKARDSFYVGGDQVKVKDGKFLWVPRLGWVKMAENLRFKGHINSIVISRTADKWYVSFSMDIEITPQPCKSQARCGVDVGIKYLATLSRGKPRYWLALETYEQLLRRLVKLQRRFSNMKKGSKHWHKQKRKIAKLYKRIADIRSNNIHLLTTYLVRNFETIIIEDLNVKGLLANHRLARAIANASFYEIRRQLEYKCRWHNRELVIADRWFPSSQICSVCGVKHKLALKERVFNCPCGNKMCRDYNASVNLERYTASSAGIYAAGDDGSIQVTQVTCVTSIGERRNDLQTRFVRFV